MDVSKLGWIDLIFINAGVKISGVYYHDMLLTHKLLSAMRVICAVFFIFQQCSAPAAAHRACETINLLEWQTPACISLDLWPPMQQHKFEPTWLQNMGRMQQQVYQVYDVDELMWRLIDVWYGFEHSVLNEAVDK